MPLANDLQALRHRTLTDLAAAHDYYQDSRTGWELVLEVLAAGRTFSVKNAVTTEADLPRKVNEYKGDSVIGTG